MNPENDLLELLEGATAAELTASKAAQIMARDGYSITGFVLTNEEGQICIVDKSAVRWLTREEFWKLMHPPQ